MKPNNNKMNFFQKLKSTTKTSDKTKHSLSAKKIIIISFSLIILIIAITMLIRPNHNAPQLPPAELAKTGIDNLLNHQTIRFSSESKLVINDNTNIYGKVEGEKSGNNIHAWGKILGSDLEVYQIDNNTYRKDSITEQWLITPTNETLEQSALMNEINPIMNFNLTGMENVQLIEDEFADEEKCYKLSLTPQMENEYLNKYFKDLTYTLWVTMDNHQIRKAIISGKIINNSVEGELSMEMEFWDWDQDIKIIPPVLQ